MGRFGGRGVEEVIHFLLYLEVAVLKTWLFSRVCLKMLCEVGEGILGKVGDVAALGCN